jgi:hypothetical protein
MTDTRFEGKDTSRPTTAGAILMVISLAIVVSVAIPVVMWRDPESGMAVPRMVAILVPILAGALFYGLGTAILKLFGIAVLKDGKEPYDGNRKNKEVNGGQEDD